MGSIPNITLNNGQAIPQFGFGVFQIEPKDTAAAVSTALEAGYRHIDTAEMYGNEAEVGEAVAASGLDRSEVFLTSKLNNDAHEPDAAREAFDGTLKALGVDYVDLFLIHWPLPMRYDGDFVSTWKTLEEFYREGRARSVGVSNFQPQHLRRLHGQTDIIPAVNQIEAHPYLTQDDVRAFCAQHQIAVEAWSPLGKGTVLDDPVVGRIADAALSSGERRYAGRKVSCESSSRERPGHWDGTWCPGWSRRVIRSPPPRGRRPRPRSCGRRARSRSSWTGWTGRR